MIQSSEWSLPDNQEIPIGPLPESEPSVSCDVAELWWDSPITNRDTAAYYAGRLLSQLRWHFTQVLFCVSPDDQRIADEALKRLVDVSYMLVRKPPNHLDDVITDVLSNWHDDLKNEDASDAVYACVDEHEPSWMIDSPAERCRELVASRVDPLVSKLRDSIWTAPLLRVTARLRIGESWTYGNLFSCDCKSEVEKTILRRCCLSHQDYARRTVKDDIRADCSVREEADFVSGLVRRLLWPT